MRPDVQSREGSTFRAKGSLIALHRLSQTSHPGEWSVPAWAALALSMGAGLALGIATFLGQGVLPDSWNAVANSGAVWLVFAFLVVSLLVPTRWRVPAATLTLLCELLGYYAGASILQNVPRYTGSVVVWVATAIVGGPLTGVASRWWRDGSRAKRVLGAAFPCAVLIAEGMFIVWRIPNHRPAGWAEVGGGLVLPLFLGRSWLERLLCLLCLLPVALIGLAAYELIDQILMHV